MANVSLSDLRDTINVSEADVPDAKLQNEKTLSVKTPQAKTLTG